MFEAIRVLPYIGIGVLLIAVLWYRGEAIDAEAKEAKAVAVAATLAAVNDANQLALDKLAESRALDASSIAELRRATDEINSATNILDDARLALERTNEVVRNYLDTAVPDDLGGMYNDKREGSGAAPR